MSDYTRRVGFDPGAIVYHIFQQLFLTSNAQLINFIIASSHNCKRVLQYMKID